MKLIAVSNLIRYALEILFLSFLVAPEVGPWTLTFMYLVTIGIEVDHIDSSHWSKK